MPYIRPEHRKWIDEAITPLLDHFKTDRHVQPGEINYAVTRIVKAWLGSNPTYHTYNTAIGVLETLKLELYRRMVAPYEDGKIAENGDVL